METKKKQEHTPEPWVLRTAQNYNIGTKDGYAIADPSFEYSSLSNEELKANARRIVACVNACAGINTDYLEGLPNDSTRLINKLGSVKAQRDELLDFVKYVVAEYGYDGHGGPLEDGESELIDRAREAIAKAKGGAA